MFRRPSVRVACLAALAAGVVVAAWYPLAAQVRARAADAAKPADGDKKEPAEAAGIRQTTEEYRKAFARGDAKALAALWTESGEFDGIDAEPVRGQAALEATYAKFFKDNPKATLEDHVESIRLLGPRAAVAEGTLQSGVAGQKKAGQETRFSAFLVLEDKGWRFASVREWEEEPAEPAEPAVSVEDLAWLAGEWTANGGKDGEARLTYSLDDNKAFLRSRYTVVHDGKVIRSGTQVIGKDPNGGLRSWQFESDGGFGESTWSRDGNRWVIEGTATLPDGTDETASHMLIPVDKDTFVWHMLGRTSGGVEEPGRPPVKVQRVKAGK
jgi:uncharacterized protein (TIGR02246 family)